MNGDEYNEVMAAAARAGESTECYIDVLNKLSESRRNFAAVDLIDLSQHRYRD